MGQSIYNLSDWVRLTLEAAQLVLVMLCYFVDSLFVKIKTNITTAQDNVDKNYNPTEKVKQFKISDVNTMFGNAIYVDFVYIFYIKRENPDDLERDMKNNQYGPKVAKVDLKSGATTDIDMVEDSYKIHAQVVIVVEKKTEEHSFYLFGGATPVQKGAGYWDYDISDKVVALNKTYDIKGLSHQNCAMLKKRILHRAVMIDEDKVMLLGGYNHADGTLKHCEVWDLDYDDLHLKGNFILPLHEDNRAKRWSEVLAPMTTARMNFGVTVMKDNPNQETDPKKYLKVVVVGGWSGRHYLNSVEIYDIASNHWTLFSCNDNCLIKASYLGCCAFLDLDGGEKDEKLVIFGGQSVESEAYGKLMESVDENNQESDLEAEKELWYDLHTKEEQGDHLSVIEQDQLKKLRLKYDPKLFEEEKQEPEQPNLKREVFFECVTTNIVNNQDRMTFANMNLGFEEYNGTYDVYFDQKINESDECKYVLEELDDERDEYLISLFKNTKYYLSHEDGKVSCSITNPLDNANLVWVINDIDQTIKTPEGLYLSYRGKKLTLSEQRREFCLLKVVDVEEDFERLDTTEIVNMSMLFKNNKGKDRKVLSKDMLVDCPELNFYTDHVLNGTMHQVSKDTYWCASADYFIRYNTTINMWNFTKQVKPLGRYYGGTVAAWFDDGYD